MFGTYLVRELTHRRKQTIIIALGMALAIALVIVVNSVAAGVRNAQASVLETVYGVGTDVTVTGTVEAPTEGEEPGMGGPRFEFELGAGDTSDGTTSLNQSRLMATPGTPTLDESTLGTVLTVEGVEAATATLSLSNTTFSGELPDMSSAQSGDVTGPPPGGFDGAGGSAFDVDAFSVEGIDPEGAAVGPLTAVSLTDGRTFESGDSGSTIAILDSAYATTEGLEVGSTITIADETFEVVGIVSSTSSDAQTASNVYIPLDTAQDLAGLDGQVSSIYVQASSSDAISQVQSDLEDALPDATVSTQADLASSVSGSLSTASSLVSSLGTWLSVIVLAAAFLIAILFTISGVTRRTREFGTLKAIGWSNGRIVGQVAGESIVQGLIGGVIGVAVGLVGILIVNLIGPTLSGSAASTSAGPGGFPGGGPGGGMPGSFGEQTAAATTDVVLQAPITVAVILIAVGLAVLGGLLAGAIGGWRASRLRPAEALRSVA
ncbi:putative ABC transport system permease protein [Microbacteriaceae bacterium SG_E_30_P1]|uniref:ABC transport system permease protein n=1 Tax=Antiquaquibacter oligotrophicus TaxID=2880260 RepID=A0ABT6KPM9_9MICO|nr:ABC transporter permease [Antiquaquibacter oligotrophicus]MDH6181948.1 putative ABC transport system permease protein [Antiquaquibacter oligotrophicus]UDF12382.1 ABC transporter permease [Antiquaquibacter oligotrophicus]